MRDAMPTVDPTLPRTRSRQSPADTAAFLPTANQNGCSSKPSIPAVRLGPREGCVARYYDPSTGEFLSLDPAVGLTEAPFNYAGDNPVNEVDPSGLSGQETVPNPCWTEGPDRPPCCAPASQNPGGTGWLGWVAIAVTIVATLPLDETGVGEGLDAAVIATETATDVAAQTTADVAADTAEDEGLGSGEAQTLYRRILVDRTRFQKWVFAEGLQHGPLGARYTEPPGLGVRFDDEEPWVGSRFCWRYRDR